MAEKRVSFLKVKSLPKSGLSPPPIPPKPPRILALKKYIKRPLITRTNSADKNYESSVKLRIGGEEGMLENNFTNAACDHERRMGFGGICELCESFCDTGGTDSGNSTLNSSKSKYGSPTPFGEDFIRVQGLENNTLCDSKRITPSRSSMGSSSYEEIFFDAQDGELFTDLESFSTSEDEVENSVEVLTSRHSKVVPGNLNNSSKVSSVNVLADSENKTYCSTIQIILKAQAKCLQQWSKADSQEVEEIAPQSKIKTLNAYANEERINGSLKECDDFYDGGSKHEELLTNDVSISSTIKESAEETKRGSCMESIVMGSGEARTRGQGITKNLETECCSKVLSSDSTNGELEESLENMVQLPTSSVGHPAGDNELTERNGSSGTSDLASCSEGNGKKEAGVDEDQQVPDRNINISLKGEEEHQYLNNSPRGDTSLEQSELCNGDNNDYENVFVPPEDSEHSRIMTSVNDSCNETADPLQIHAVIDFPYDKVQALKLKKILKSRGSLHRLDSFAHKRSYRINKLMVTDFLAHERSNNQVLRKLETSKKAHEKLIHRIAPYTSRKGLRKSKSSNLFFAGKYSDEDETDQIDAKVPSAFSSFKLPFSEKTRHQLSRSSSAMQSRMDQVKRKMGSWYTKRVKGDGEESLSKFSFKNRFRSSKTSTQDLKGLSVIPNGTSQGVHNRQRTESIYSTATTSDCFIYSDIDDNFTDIDSQDVYSDVTPQTTVVPYSQPDPPFPLQLQGQNEFEELRRVVKQGADFCKDLASVLQERSELEATYAKGLSKLSGKLLKASKEATGSVAHAWQAVAVQIETQAELHRQWSTSLLEEISKPLKSSTDTQHKIRKSVEVLVEKTTRNLAEWRTAEAKAKRQCFSSSKEFEKLQESVTSSQMNGNANSHALSRHSVSGSTTNISINDGKTKSRLLSVSSVEKDPIKMEAKRRKAEEAVRRADIEYYTFCVRSERSRLEWEGAIRNGSTCLRTLEEEKLSLLKDLVVKYYQHLSEFAPKLVNSTESLHEPVMTANVEEDMNSVTDVRKCNGSDQLLPDFYAEDTSNLMRKERRKEALQKFLYLINQDLEREKKGAEGVENLAKAIADSPKIDTGQHDITDKMFYMKSMLLYLEGSRCKVDIALADVEGRTRKSYAIMKYVRHQRDKQGLPQTILKIPQWARDECVPKFTYENGSGSRGSNSPDWTERGNADGNSNQHDADFDEFSSSEGSEHIGAFGEETKPVSVLTAPSVGRCRAIYDYDAQMFDELSIRTGDVLNIHDKQEDGWWLGDLDGVVGIFPATYVEEFKDSDSTDA